LAFQFQSAFFGFWALEAHSCLNSSMIVDSQEEFYLRFSAKSDLSFMIDCLRIHNLSLIKKFQKVLSSNWKFHLFLFPFDVSFFKWDLKDFLFDQTFVESNLQDFTLCLKRSNLLIDLFLEITNPSIVKQNFSNILLLLFPHQHYKSTCNFLKLHF